VPVVVSVTRSGGFAEPVQLRLLNYGAGLSATTTELAPGATTATLTLTASAAAEARSRALWIVGTGGETSHAIVVPLTVGSGAAGTVGVSVSPAPTTSVAVGGTRQLTATVSGTANTAVTWSTSAAGTATVSAAGLVTGVAAGTAVVTATSVADPSRTASTTVTVTAGSTPPPGGAGITLAVVPGSLNVGLGGRATVAVTVARTGGYAGNVALNVSDVPYDVSYEFDASLLLPGATAATLTLDVSTRAIPGSYTFTIRATGSGVPAATQQVALTIARVQPGKFAARTLAVGGGHACAVTEAGAAWCWGGSSEGKLGNGIAGSSGSAYVPTAVVGGHTFTTITAGADHSCALDTAGRAWCWGRNWQGELGSTEVPTGMTNAAAHSAVPVAVAGGRTYVAISAGGQGTCAIGTDGATYCWGEGGIGELGDGSWTEASPVPVQVAGGHAFVSVSRGSANACALTAAGEAYCWGYGQFGALTRAGPEASNVPLRVASGHTFVSLTSLTYRACGVTSAGAAWCWGMNDKGQLGTGATGTTHVPGAVAGGLAFAAIGSGYGSDHTCGVTTAGAAYCWGSNSGFRMGTGTSASGPFTSPVAVAGDLTFTDVQTGTSRACGITTAGYVYCWGTSALGAGDPAEWPFAGFALSPVPVALPETP
jgi:alpha-tubulin suppressor-like RCC1 family protein